MVRYGWIVEAQNKSLPHRGMSGIPRDLQNTRHGTWVLEEIYVIMIKKFPPKANRFRVELTVHLVEK